MGVGDVAMTVVEDEQEPAGEGGESRIGTQQSIEFCRDGPDVSATPCAAGEWRDRDVSNEFMARLGEQSDRPDRVDEASTDAIPARRDATDLNIGARRQMQVAVAERFRDRQNV